MVKKTNSIASDFFAFFALERKRFLYKWNLCAWFIILVLLFLSVNQRTNQIIDCPINNKNLKKFKKNIFKVLLIMRYIVEMALKCC